MVRVSGVLLLLLAAGPLGDARAQAMEAQELVQMPQHLTPSPDPAPTPVPTPVPTPAPIPVMPQYLPQPQIPQVQPQAQNIPEPPADPEPFMMQCRTNRTEMIFMLNPEYGLVQNVSSFPRTTGVLYVSEMEYVLVFSSRDIDITLEFVINRYTGRLTAVANGERVVSTGNCRKVRARALF